MRQIAILLTGLLVFGCRSNIPLNQKKVSEPQVNKIRWKQIDLDVNQLIALDIQENLTLYDELFMTYSLSVVEQDSVMKAVHGTHHFSNVKKGAKLSLDSIPDLRLDLKEGQKLGIQIALWEIDDYSKSQILFSKVSHFSGALQLPLTLVEWSSASNPLSWFLWATRLSSMGLDFLATLDQDDLLGMTEAVWTWDELSNQRRPRFNRVVWKGKGSAINSFHYELGYQIKIKDIVK